MKIKSGTYAGSLLCDVPLNYLVWYFSRCKDLELKEEIKKILLKTNDSKIIEKVYKKELEDILISPYMKKKLRDDAKKAEFKNRVTYLLKAIQNSPNFKGIKLDINQMSNEIVNSTFKKSKNKK